jgi:hypothetical protein
VPQYADMIDNFQVGFEAPALAGAYACLAIAGKYSVAEFNLIRMLAWQVNGRVLQGTDGKQQTVQCKIPPDVLQLMLKEHFCSVASSSWLFVCCLRASAIIATSYLTLGVLLFKLPNIHTCRS